MNYMNSTHLCFQRPSLIHLDAAIAIHCDPETNRFNPFGTPVPATVEDNLHKWIAHWEKNGFGYWAVSLSDHPETILGFGGITQTQIGRYEGLNLYFRLAPAAWGKGIGGGIGNAGLRSAFVDLHAVEVFGLVRPNNLPSRRTLEKVGLRQFDTSDDVPGNSPSLIYRIGLVEYSQQKRQ